MIFKNIDFHNVEEIKETKNGYQLCRIPKYLREKLNEKGNEASYFSTGVELRFKIKSDEATIVLRAEDSKEAQIAYIFYGSIQGGWENSSRIIYTENTSISLKKVDNLTRLKEIENEFNLPFNSEVVRIILPYCKCSFVDVTGDIEPPSIEDVPKNSYLAYGSSITHGSLALLPVRTYPFEIAKRLNCDYINLGFAGSAHLEREMAEYIVSRKDWSFATVELGINLLEIIDTEDFKKRVSEFIDILSKDKRKIFCTDLFTNYMDGKADKINQFRKIVKECATGKLIYTNGDYLMSTMNNLSADLVHPNIYGIAEITDKWCDIIRDAIKG